MSSSRSAVAQIAAGLAALLAVDVDDLPVPSCGPEAVELMRLASGLQAAAAARLARFDAHRGHDADCAATTASWLRRQLPLDEVDARTRVAAARVLRDLPDVAAAYAAGRVTDRHLRVLARAARRVGIDVLVAAEPTLLELATSAPPADLQVLVDRLAAAVEADEDRDAAALRVFESRHLYLTRGFQGGYSISGELDEAGGRAVEAMLTAYGQKKRLPDGSPDSRTKAQRHADALVQAAETALQAGDIPVVGKLPVAVTLVTDLPTLKGEQKRWAPGSVVANVFRHGFGPAALDRLTCTADVTPAVVTATGVPLALGRTTRLATPDQMKALRLRDGGCVMPGCTNPRVQAHHIVPWSSGGRTDVTDLALVCTREHTLLHEYGWALEHDPDRPGLLRWRPPDGRPPIPARHTIDRDPGHKHPLW